MAEENSGIMNLDLNLGPTSPPNTELRSEPLISEGSFFDCNICLDLSSDPVLTSCGHLYCWPCLYQWLNIHSDTNECPVCKGEVTNKNLTPVYGRGQHGKINLKVPDRPPARRVESWRQTIQRNAYPIPMEEMIRLGSGFDFSRDLVEVQPQTVESLNESPERNRSLLNRILTSRAMHQEQTPNETIDRGVASYLRRSHTYRSAPTAELANITQRMIESYIRYTSAERLIQDQPIPADDRDSVSSIAAVIHTESQNLDTAVEINSRVLNSTSSFRRGIDGSMVADVDGGDSRAPRRRRLN